MAAHGRIGETMRKSVQRVQRAGRGGDTRLAHVNPREQRMLKASGGSGKINSKTGLKSFEGGGRDGSTVVRRFRAADAPSKPGPFVVGSGTKTETTAGAPVREGRGGLVTTRARTPLPAAVPIPKPAAPAVARAPDVSPVATAAPKATPIGKSFIGAVNRSPGNTGSTALSAASIRRAKIAGTKRADIIVNVDESGL